MRAHPSIPRFAMKIRNSRPFCSGAAAALSVALVLLAPAPGITVAVAAESSIPAIADYKLVAGPAEASQSRPFVLNAPRKEPPGKPENLRRFANQRFASLIDEAARNAALDPALVHAVIAVESGYNPAARSAKGAVGLMQVLPETASRYGVADPASSPEANLRAGTRYLSYLMVLFQYRIELVLAAYNAGEYAVLRYGHRIPPYRETQLYVPAVLARYHEWREPEAPLPPRTGIVYMPGTVLEAVTADARLRGTGDTRRHSRF